MFPVRSRHYRSAPKDSKISTHKISPFDKEATPPYFEILRGPFCQPFCPFVILLIKWPAYWSLSPTTERRIIFALDRLISIRLILSRNLMFKILLNILLNVVSGLFAYWLLSAQVCSPIASWKLGWRMSLWCIKHIPGKVKIVFIPQNYFSLHFEDGLVVRRYA